MAEASDTAAIIHQNLIDAGCDPQTIKLCMTIVKNGRYAQMLPLLARHRAALLETVRSGQKQIDCLDYLIYQIDHDPIGGICI